MGFLHQQRWNCHGDERGWRWVLSRCPHAAAGPALCEHGYGEMSAWLCPQPLHFAQHPVLLSTSQKKKNKNPKTSRTSAQGYRGVKASLAVDDVWGSVSAAGCFPAPLPLCPGCNRIRPPPSKHFCSEHFQNVLHLGDTRGMSAGECTQCVSPAPAAALRHFSRAVPCTKKSFWG